MQTKNNMIEDYTPVLEQNFGKVGSAEWKKSIEEADAFYAAQMIRDTRKVPLTSYSRPDTTCLM